MKKRLLVLLAFGVSFAPPVFAAGERIPVRALGELKLSETDLRGANCALQDKNLRGHEATSSGSTQQASGGGSRESVGKAL